MNIKNISEQKQFLITVNNKEYKILYCYNFEQNVTSITILYERESKNTPVMTIVNRKLENKEVENIIAEVINKDVSKSVDFENVKCKVSCTKNLSKIFNSTILK